MPLDLSSLIAEEARPFIDAYQSLEGELEAVQRRQKAMAMHDWPKSAIDSDLQEYEEVVSKAIELGLSVIHRPYQVSTGGSSETIVRVFVLHDDQAWRVPAFMALMKRLRTHGWCDAMECLESELLGYDEQQIDRWIGFHRHRQAGWTGTTVFFLVTAEQRKRIREFGNTCIPPAAFNESPEIIVFMPRGFFVVRRDADQLALPHDFYIARAAVRYSFATELLGSEASNVNVSSMSLKQSVWSDLNKSLLTKLQFLKDGEWL